MIDFVFTHPTDIVFGKDAEAKTGELISGLGRKVLFHYGGGSIKANGVYEKVRKSLDAAGIEVYELGGVAPNPRISLVYEGIEVCKKHGLEAILAVGGGSVIDSAKGIAAGAMVDHDVWDFYDGKAEPKAALPIGVVLTIPAAGSEASPGSVVTRKETSEKRFFNTDLVRPAFAIMNPESTYSLPPYQTAAGLADIMSHVFERYFTKEPAVGYSDRLCEATLKTIVEFGPRVLEKPRDYDARAQVMWAGTIAHNDLLGRGREEDWSSHMIEHELSGEYDVTHGAGLAVIFPAWMRYVYKEDVDRFVRFAVEVWGVENNKADPDRTALEGINRLVRFFKSIGMPTTLGELGIEDDRFEEMARNAVRGETIGFFKSLNADDVVKIYELAREA